jgi:hypothetical protein
MLVRGSKRSEEETIMGNRARAKAKTTSENLVAGHKAAWQRWNSTRTGWETKVQQLCHMNFVFQVVWEPRGRALWGQHRDELMNTTVLAKRAWEAWQLTLVSAPGETANSFALPSGSVTTPTFHWHAQLQETQSVWAYVLAELNRAVPDDQLFLPADVRRLMNELHQACQQIVQKTEQSMLAWQIWGAQQGVLGQSAEQSAKLPTRAMSRTHKQAEPTSFGILR